MTEKYTVMHQKYSALLSYCAKSANAITIVWKRWVWADKEGEREAKSVARDFCLHSKKMSQSPSSIAQSAVNGKKLILVTP